MRGRSLGKQLNLCGNPSVLNIPWCTHDISHNHHDIPQCTHGIAQCTEHPRCTHDISHTHHGTPRCTHGILALYLLNTPGVLIILPSVLNTPSVLNDIPQCTEHLPVYCTDIMQGVSQSDHVIQYSPTLKELLF